MKKKTKRQSRASVPALAKQSVAKLEGEVYASSLPHSKNIKLGKADELKARIAKKTLMAGGFSREAGMMIDGMNTTSTSYAPGFVQETYRNSYASGLGYKSGVYDVPTFVQVMNQKNGGMLQFPASLQERYSWYRWYARSEPLVSRALDLLSDLPMSKLSLHVPKHVPEGMKTEIKDFFEEQVRKLNLFDLCGNILYELFCEWDNENKMWERIQMLPPEEVFVFEIPFNDEKRIEYRPRRLVSMILGATGSLQNNELEDQIVEAIPQEIKDSIKTDGCILLDSNSMNGSFCHHIARRKAPYLDLSASLLDRVLVPLQLKDFYKFTQMSLASRNMTPKNLIIAPNCTPEELDELRNQVDLSYLDPDYSIVCNFDVRWETIGSRDRLLELQSEYERLDNEIFAAMGVTRELLTGEGSYSGTKITVEILHSMFLHSREILVDFIEQQLFIPICEKKNWFEVGKNKIKKYFYPKVGFNRLTIRDNAEVFDSLFQLYQKGSLPVEVIYDLFNLDTTEIDEKLYKDLFTVRDATFNELIRNVLSESGRGLVENSDVTQKIADYLKLKFEKPAEEGAGGMPGMEPGQAPAEPEGAGAGQEMDLSTLVENSLGDQAQTQPETGTEKEDSTNFDTGDSIEDKANEIAGELPSTATPESIMEKILQKKIEWETLTPEEQDSVTKLIVKDLPPNCSDEDIIKEIHLKTRGILK